MKHQRHVNEKSMKITEFQGFPMTIQWKSWTCMDFSMEMQRKPWGSMELVLGSSEIDGSLLISNVRTGFRTGFLTGYKTCSRTCAETGSDILVFEHVLEHVF